MSAVGPGPGVEANELTPQVAVDVTLGADFNVATAFNAGCCRELFVGTGGTVIAQMIGDAAPHTYKNLPSGTPLAGRFILVKSTANGTTAADIVARY